MISRTQSLRYLWLVLPRAPHLYDKKGRGDKKKRGGGGRRKRQKERKRGRPMTASYCFRNASPSSQLCTTDYINVEWTKGGEGVGVGCSVDQEGEGGGGG